MLAAHFGVPIILATGDAHYVEHVHDILGADVATVTTKESTGRYSADTLTPSESCRLIRAATIEALASPLRPAPPASTGPITLSVDFQRHIPAELLSYLPGFERRDATGIEATLTDKPTVIRILNFVTAIKFDEQIPS